MLNNVSQVKDFIKFCRESKIKSCSIGNVSFEFDAEAFIEEDELTMKKEIFKQQVAALKGESGEWVSGSTDLEQDDDMFWSAGKEIKPTGL